MIKATVFYPYGSGKMDLDYYLDKHIPLVEERLAPYGLIKVEVDKAIESPEGETPPYRIIAHMYFESMERMREGMEKYDPELAADVPNYTDIQPVFQMSEVISG